MFYKYLFDLYTEKFEIVQKENHFFSEFVLLFTNLALYDKSYIRYQKILNWFLCFQKSQGNDKISHCKFVARYLTYLYEDAFENLECFKLSFKKEIILKRNFSQSYINIFEDVLTEYPDLKSDEIMTGLYCLFIFRCEVLHEKDAILF